MQSVLNQDYRDLELILFDDGSSEQFREDIAQLELLDERIVILSSESNKGLAHGLNMCLERVQGEYIARMDADDYSVDSRIGKQLKFLEENHDYGWCGTDAIVFDDIGEWGIANRPRRPENEDFYKYSPYIHPSVMFRSSVLKSAGGYCEDKECLRCEDLELFARLHAMGLRGYNIHENLYGYRVDRNEYHSRNMSNRLSELKVRWRIYKMLNLKGIRCVLAILRPVIAGVIPIRLRRMIKRRTSSV